MKERVQTARREALAAAADALEDFMSAVELDLEGRMVNRIGTAHLILYKPRRVFWKAAYSTGLIQYRAVGDTRLFREYLVMEFQVPRGHPAYESADAQKLFCFTAAVVMQRYFPSESWMVVSEAKD